MTTKKTILSALVVLLAAAMLTTGAGAADLKKAEGRAAQLKEMGLFRGISDTEFDLNREPTRVEALVMLIRTLGEEKTALSGSRSHPFTDVPAWADAYVGYAYETGLTRGISATEFGSGNASAAMYVTFMLRALGYSDGAGDFAWDNPFALAREVGILTDDADTARFLRADAVEVSFAALSANMKGTDISLADTLKLKGVLPPDKPEGAGGSGEGAGAALIFKPEPVYILPVEPKEPAIDE